MNNTSMKNTALKKLLSLVAITGFIACTGTDADGPGMPGDAGFNDAGAPAECERGADCPTGSTCVSGQCEALACAIPSDCPVGYACQDNSCGPADGSPGPGLDPTRTEPVEGDGPNRAVGIVTDLDGNPLQGVSITVDDEPVMASTDASGAYEIKEVPPGPHIVHVTADGYLGYSRKVNVAAWETVFVSARLMPRAASVAVDASAGASVGNQSGSVTIPANALVTAEGVPVDTQVQVSVTPIDPTGAEIEAAPGDYVASETTGGDDDLTPLVSYGMVDLTVTDGDGQPIDLAEGEEIEAVLPAPDGLQEGDVIPTWIWDRDIPAWVRQDTATVENRDGELVLVGSINQTNIVWNCDDPEVEVCYTGEVVDCAGFPVRGAEVQLFGGGTNSLTTDRTDADGRYMVRGTARGGAIVRARMRLGLTEYVVDSEIVPVSGDGCAPVDPHVFSEIRYTGGRIELGRQEVWAGTAEPSTTDVGSAIFYDPLAPTAGVFQTCTEDEPDVLRVERFGGDEESPELLDVGNPILIEGDAGRLDLVRTYEQVADGLELSNYFIIPGSELAGGEGERLSVDIPGAPAVVPHTVLSDALYLPETLEVTSPSADAPREVDASAGLPLRWVPSTGGATLAIIIGTRGDALGLIGNLQDDGAFDVTPEQLESFRGQSIQVSMMRFHERYERLSTGPAVALRGFSTVGFDVDVQ